MSRQQLQEAVRNNDPNLKLIKYENAKSDAWHSFWRVKYNNKNVDYVCCIHCKTVLAHTPKTGTGTLLRHKCRKEPEFKMKTSKQDMHTRKRIRSAVPLGLARKYMSLVDRELLPLSVVEDHDFRDYAQMLINIGAKYGSVNVDDVLLSTVEIEKGGISSVGKNSLADILITDNDTTCDGDPLIESEPSIKRQRLVSDSDDTLDSPYDSVKIYDDEATTRTDDKAKIPKTEIAETSQNSFIEVIDTDALQKQEVASKYQELVEKEIATVEEKREQQKIQHDLKLKHIKAEFELKMLTMREERKLKKLQLERYLKTMANDPNSVDREQ